jgi:hypothetical protein
MLLPATLDRDTYLIITIWKHARFDWLYDKPNHFIAQKPFNFNDVFFSPRHHLLTNQNLLFSTEEAQQFFPSILISPQPSFSLTSMS